MRTLRCKARADRTGSALECTEQNNIELDVLRGETLDEDSYAVSSQRFIKSCGTTPAC
jgi:hypothetical protein